MGYAFTALLALALLLVLTTSTAPWCAAEVGRFRDVMLLALAADVGAAQPLLLCGTALWRWLNDDSDDDDECAECSDDDEANGTAAGACRPATATPRRTMFELHPIDGQWRELGYVAGLFVPDSPAAF